MNDQKRMLTWTVVARSRELKSKPLRVFYDEKPVVIFRDSGSVKALRDLCPHRGMPLSEGCVKDGSIECRYHAWSFSGEGRLLSVPGAQKQPSLSSPVIESFAVEEKHGLIWLAARSQSADVLSIPEINETKNETHQFATVSTYVEANKIDIIENFLDALHTHTVHAGFVRSAHKKRRPCEVQISNIEAGYQASYKEQHRQSGFLSAMFGRHITKSIGRVRFPGIVEIDYCSPNGLEMSVLVFVNQEQEGRCKLILRTYVKRSGVPFFAKLLLLAPFQWLVFQQDKRILEKQYMSMKSNKDFVPRVVPSDIMRPFIEKALKNQIEPIDEEKVIFL